ncbi:MAG TPA: MFS transporter [Oceanipulchritudo sp.]|nr:MFS transporter [Oceanipulchritudo sp.]
MTTLDAPAPSLSFHDAKGELQCRIWLRIQTAESGIPIKESINTADARWNYRAFLLDGGAFACGIGFVNAQTLLPGVILDLDGPSWLAAFVPSAMVLGLFSVPVFIAPWVDRMAWVKSFVLVTTIPQRMLYLVAGILLLWPALVNERATPWILALTPLLSGIFAGISITAFQRLFMHGIPSRMRASNFAYRLMIGGVAGVITGRIVEWFLDEFSLQTALGMLHLIAFGWMILSWVALSMVREREVVPEPVAPRSWKSIFDGLRDFLAPGPARRGHGAFLVALSALHGFFIIAPFYADHFRRVAGLPVSYLGTLSMWFMGGNALGNLFAAWLGDRFGGRLAMRTGLLLFGLGNIVAPFVTRPALLGPLFAMLGFSFMLAVVGKESLQFDLSPQSRQARYLAGMSLVTMLSIFGGSLTSYLLWNRTGSFAVLAGVAAASALIGFVALGQVNEPRMDVPHNPLEKIRRGILRYLSR